MTSPPTNSETARFCVSCGATLEDGGRFCGECGTPVSQNRQATARRSRTGKLLALGAALVLTVGSVWAGLTAVFDVDANVSSSIPERIDRDVAVATEAYLEEHEPMLRAFDEATDAVLASASDRDQLPERCEELGETLDERFDPQELFTTAAEIPDRLLASLWFEGQWARLAALTYCGEQDWAQMDAEAADARRIAELVEWRRAELREARA